MMDRTDEDRAAREERLVADGVIVATYEAPFSGPYGKWAVHRIGQRLVPFNRLVEAKAWVETQYGPVTWSRDERPNGRKMAVEWTPKTKP